MDSWPSVLARLTVRYSMPSDAPTRSLSARFDNLKSQYQGDLVTLTQDKEALLREITELKSSRDTYLEETTALNARNEELAKLGAQYARRAESVGVFVPPPAPEIKTSLDRTRPPVSMTSSSTASLAMSNGGTADDSSSSSSHTRVARSDVDTAPVVKPKVFKWPGSKASKESTSSASLSSQLTDTGRGKALEHVFQQLNVLRFTRCDHCGDKMWGSQYRCTSEWSLATYCDLRLISLFLQAVTSLSIRVASTTSCLCARNSRQARNPTCSSNRCVGALLYTPAQCSPVLPAPSMFGRALIDQVRSDAKGSDRHIPMIVEKCINAVEALGK